MSFKDDFNIFIGAKYGIFKGVKATEKHPIITKNMKNLDFLSKDTDVTALAWSNDDEEDILIGLSNQVVSTYDTNFKAFTLSSDVRITTEHGASEGSICGLSRFDGGLVTAAESGHVRVVRFEDEKCVDIYAEGPISKMRHSKTNPCTIGTGGMENELKLWDLNKGTKTFNAKNVPPDWLQLRVKVWVNDHHFMPSSDKVVVGSKYGYVRLYDPKAQRRPVIKVDMPEKAVTCIAPSGDDHTVLCGLTKGNIVTVDLRMGLASENYKGFVGAVRDIACHPSEPYVVSVGLDRFLRIHHKTTKKLLLSEYMVSRMNCVLLRSNFTLKSSLEVEKKNKTSTILAEDDESDNEERQEFNEMFNEMEEVVDRSKKKTKNTAQSEVLKSTETPSKKRKLNAVLNPFAVKSKQSKSTVESVCPKSSNKTKVEIPCNVEKDSDDDIMIIEEVVTNSTNSAAGEEDELEADEAEGDSEEFDEEEGHATGKKKSTPVKRKNGR